MRNETFNRTPKTITRQIGKAKSERLPRKRKENLNKKSKKKEGKEKLEQLKAFANRKKLQPNVVKSIDNIDTDTDNIIDLKHASNDPMSTEDAKRIKSELEKNRSNIEHEEQITYNDVLDEVARTKVYLKELKKKTKEANNQAVANINKQGADGQENKEVQAIVKSNYSQTSKLIAPAVRQINTIQSNTTLNTTTETTENRIASARNITSTAPNSQKETKEKLPTAGAETTNFTMIDESPGARKEVKAPADLPTNNNEAKNLVETFKNPSEAETQPKTEQLLIEDNKSATTPSFTAIKQAIVNRQNQIQTETQQTITPEATTTLTKKDAETLTSSTKTPETPETQDAKLLELQNQLTKANKSKKYPEMEKILNEIALINKEKKKQAKKTETTANPENLGFKAGDTVKVPKSDGTVAENGTIKNINAENETAFVIWTEGEENKWAELPLKELKDAQTKRPKIIAERITQLKEKLKEANASNNPEEAKRLSDIIVALRNGEDTQTELEKEKAQKEALNKTRDDFFKLYKIYIGGRKSKETIREMTGIHKDEEEWPEPLQTAKKAYTNARHEYFNALKKNQDTPPDELFDKLYQDEQEQMAKVRQEFLRKKQDGLVGKVLNFANRHKTAMKTIGWGIAISGGALAIGRKATAMLLAPLATKIISSGRESNIATINQETITTKESFNEQTLNDIEKKYKEREKQIKNVRKKYLFYQTIATAAVGGGMWASGAFDNVDPDALTDKPPTRETPTTPNITQATPPLPDTTLQTTNQPYTVQEGDTLNNILTQHIPGHGVLTNEALQAKLNAMNEYYKNHPRELQKLGISSGDIDVIKPGEEIDADAIIAQAETTTTAGETAPATESKPINSTPIPIPKEVPTTPFTEHITVGNETHNVQLISNWDSNDGSKYYFDNNNNVYRITDNSSKLLSPAQSLEELNPDYTLKIINEQYGIKSDDLSGNIHLMPGDLTLTSIPSSEYYTADLDSNSTPEYYKFDSNTKAMELCSPQELHDYSLDQVKQDHTSRMQEIFNLSSPGSLETEGITRVQAITGHGGGLSTGGDLSDEYNYGEIGKLNKYITELEVESHRYPIDPKEKLEMTTSEYIEKLLEAKAKQQLEEKINQTS